MSLARQEQGLFDRSAEGGAARSLPLVEHAPRPAQKARPKKRSWAGVATLGLGWICVLALSLVVVHRNTLVLAETAEITTLREGLAQVEQQIHEKETRLAEQQSMGRVEDWARTKGWVRNNNVKTVALDPTAVAVQVRPVQPAAAPAPQVGKKGGFLDSVKSYLAQWQAARAASSGVR